MKTISMDNEDTEKWLKGDLELLEGEEDVEKGREVVEIDLTTLDALMTDHIADIEAAMDDDE